MPHSLGHEKVLPVPVIPREQKLAGWNEVGDAHPFAPGIASRLRHVAAEGHRVVEARRERVHTQQISVPQHSLHPRGIQRERFHVPAFVVFNLLQQNAILIRQVGQAAGVVQGRSH